MLRGLTTPGSPIVSSSESPGSGVLAAAAVGLCCGLPLLLGAGVGLATLGLIVGSVTLAAVAAVAGGALVAWWWRRRAARRSRTATALQGR